VLLEETYGVRPTHGVLVLAKGRQELVPFTIELEAELEQAVQRMRQILESPEATEPCWSPGKCGSCGYRELCWGPDLAPRSSPAPTPQPD
jgi:CRISPR/Cas system-associated exonuclease Cas4 (RecB family)